MIYASFNESALDTTDYLKEVKLKNFGEATSIMEAGAIAAIEVEKEWNSIMQECAIDSLREEVRSYYCTVNEAGEEAEAAETTEDGEKVEDGEKKKNWLQTVFDKIIKAFQTAFRYIGGLLSKALNAFKGAITKDATLVKDQTIFDAGCGAMTPEEKKVNMFKPVKFSDISIDKAAEVSKQFAENNYGKIKRVTSGTKEEIDDYRKEEEITARKNTIRGLALNGLKVTGSTIDEDTFSKGLKEAYSTKAEEFSIDEVASVAFDNIKSGSKEAREAIKKSYNSVKAEINKHIKNAKALKKDFEKNDLTKSKKACISVFIAECNLCTSCMQRTQNAALAQVSADYRSSRAIVSKCYIKGLAVKKAESGKGSKKEEKVGESTIDFSVNLI